MPAASSQETTPPSAPEPVTGDPVGSDVLEMSLEDLLNVEVTSVSKRAEKRTAAPAAIFVITQEDIRRSTATTIPDLLRTVPGLHVAQHDANKWSVSARGFSGRFANKLLVLIDGRTIYTPFFSGVYWEANDVMLEDVDRIEIIRGPGGTLWGANAVNGVINIVTQKSEDTQGGLVSVGGGSELNGSGALRYGGKIGDLGYYRAYAKYFRVGDAGSFVEDGTGPTGGDANDHWQNGQIGFRMDFDLSDDESITLIGGAQAIGANSTYDLPYYSAPLIVRTDDDSEFQDYHLLTRWSRRLADDSEIQLQGYVDLYHSDNITLDEQRSTIDIDFQHRLKVGDRQNLLWGLGFRLTTDDFDNTAFIVMDPEHETDLLFSAFVQNEIALLDTLRLTLGTKVEHNDYTGLEFQPSARIVWTPNDRHTLWAAVSRAVRTPSRAESDIRINYGETAGIPGVFVSAVGDGSVQSEELLALETGYRVQPTERLALDIAFFYNDYSHARTLEAGTPFLENEPAPPHTILPISIVTTANATVWGAEVGADLSLRPWWSLRAAYAFINGSADDAIDSTGADNAPHNMFSLQNRFDLPHNVEIDTTLRYVDDIQNLGVDDYVEMDARLAWRPRKDLELALIGRNLLDSQHGEFDDAVEFTVPTQVQRSICGKITWRF